MDNGYQPTEIDNQKESIPPNSKSNVNKSSSLQFKLEIDTTDVEVNLNKLEEQIDRLINKAETLFKFTNM